MKVVLPEETRNIDFALNRGGTISGRISDRDGEPIVGAYVNAHTGFATDIDFAYNYGWAVTDEEGKYTMSGLRSGAYIVSASASTSWYTITKWYDNVTSVEEATPVSVVHNQDTPGIDFEFELIVDLSLIHI